MGWSRWLAAAADRVLDPTIVLSFDRHGFVRHSASFDESDLQVDLTGRVVAITGANSGIGLATSHALAARGATVWMLCRSEERGKAAREAVVSASGNADVHLARLDVSDLADIQSFVERWDVPRLDVLVHNAGVLLRAPATSVQGLELTLATNLVGPFALTQGLRERLQGGADARVIWVSSGGMYTHKLCVADLNPGPTPFDGVKAYARTKRAMVVVSEQLAARLASDNISVHCMHPGWADTPGVEHSIPGFWRVTRSILRSSEQGADTVIWLAITAGARLATGRFWFDRRARSTHLLPGTRASAEEREQLWSALHGWSGCSLERWDPPKRS